LGMEFTGADRITIDPRICHGKPVIRVTLVSVSILTGSPAGCMSLDDVAREHGVTHDDIRAGHFDAGVSVSRNRVCSATTASQFGRALVFTKSSVDWSRRRNSSSGIRSLNSPPPLNGRLPIAKSAGTTIQAFSEKMLGAGPCQIHRVGWSK